MNEVVTRPLHLPRRPLTEEQETLVEFPIVQGEQEKETDPRQAAIVPYIQPRSCHPWQAPFLIRDVRVHPLTIIHNALNRCRRMHHGKIARTVYLPFSLPEGESSIIYDGQMVIIKSDRALPGKLPPNIAWCTGV